MGAVVQTKTEPIVAITATFLAKAAARGARPPLSLAGADARGWPLSIARGDMLVLDEFGELWWARTGESSGHVRVLRSCWPEEVRSLHDAIVRALSMLADNS